MSVSRLDLKRIKWLIFMSGGFYLNYCYYFYVNMKIERAELEMTLIDKLRQKRKKYLFMWYNISEAIMYKLNG